MSSRAVASKQNTKFSAKKLFKFVGIMLVCIYAAYILIEQQMTLSAIEASQETRRKAISAGKLETQALEDKLNKARNDDAYIEQVIRDNLGYIKPNERIYIDISREK